MLVQRNTHPNDRSRYQPGFNTGYAPDVDSSWWLKVNDGLASRVTAGGLLIGRSPHCDLVLRSEMASRRHALVYLGEDGPQLELLGAKAELNGKSIEGSAALSDGDRIGLPELEVEVLRGDEVPHEETAVWLLEGPSGALFAVNRDPFRVGGALEDDVRVEGWPEGVLRLSVRKGALLATADKPMELDGAPLPAGETRGLRVGSRVALDGASVVVATGGELGAGSTVGAEIGGAVEVRLEFLPRGGRLHVSHDSANHTVYLSDRRCDLIAVLLQPPSPFNAGDFVDDSQIIARVWGAKSHADRTHLNVLLHRVRKDFDRAGLDGSLLLERAEGGGATRFLLLPGTTVRLD